MALGSKTGGRKKGSLNLLGDVMRKSRDVGRALTMRQHPDLMMRIAAEKARKKGQPPRIAQTRVGARQ
jgi:hypothetical protein